MNNVTLLPTRPGAKQHKRPETILAEIAKDGDPLDRLYGALSKKPVTEIGAWDPIAKIEAALSYNRQLLDGLPKPAEVQGLLQTVKDALSTTTESSIKKQVAFLLGAYPNAAPTVPEAYTAMLIFDIMDMGIPDAVVFTTCRELRRTLKFLPTIAEFLAVAEKHLKHWRCTDLLPDRLTRARESIEDAIKRAELSLAEIRRDIENGWRDADGKLLEIGRPLPKFRASR